jgi:signal transduction histidine kinase/FixJ family two-component response regulator
MLLLTSVTDAFIMPSTSYKLFDRMTTLLKKQFVIIGCLMLLHPHAVLAGQETASVPISSLWFPLLLLMLSAVVGWLSSRIRRIKKENNDISVRLQLVQQALDQAPFAVLWTDSNLKIVQVNQAALRSAGVQPLIGSDLLTLNPKFETHPVIAALRSGEEGVVSMPAPDPSRSADRGDSQQELLTLVAADSKKFAIWYANPLTDGRPLDAKNGCNEQVEDKPAPVAESASRMKSVFIANINHEIRTPMNAIIGYAEMLMNADLGPREKRFVNIIHKSSLTLVSIFNDIMELSKIDSGRMQIMYSSVRLQSIINDVEGLFKDLAQGKGLRFRCHMAPHLPQIFIMDGVRLKQILQNLVSNAIKFTAKGAVELVVDGEPSHDTIGCFDLRFTVKDSGIGIPFADQEKIFGLFQQRENTISGHHSGIGLGLTLCSRLVAMMGGRIELVSTEGNGAQFTVLLETIKVAEQMQEDLSTPAVSMIKGKEKKLLIVDDVDLIKDVFVDYFQNSSSCKVLTANNGEEALTLAGEEKPDIIFMDLNLIGMDGRTVTEHLRNQPETATIPVVVMTGEMLDETDYKPLFDDFLQKPFRLEDLRKMVDRYIPFCHANDQHPIVVASIIDQEQNFLDAIEGVWTVELDALRAQAVRSGSLADAVSLGAAMLQAGGKCSEPLLSEIGGELVQYAAEPDILGVDRLLAKLSSITNRKQL